MRLAYGAVQRRGTLDHLIERLAERPPERLRPAAAGGAAARASTSCSTSAARPTTRSSADAVELAKAQRARAATGSSTRSCAAPRARARAELLGGPRRRHSRAGRAEALPSAVDRASCGGGSSGPTQARALMAADNEPGELALRANTLRRRRRRRSPRELPVASHRDPRIPEALVLEEPFDVHGSPLWRAGAFIAQSRAAMLVARALAPAARASACSTCARRPAARATHLAALMERRGRGRGGRAQPPAAPARWRATAERLRAANVRVRGRRRPAAALDGEAALRPGARRSALLGPRNAAGAPRPALADAARGDRRRWPAPQARILAAGAAVLRPGGVLVYSTCTISPTENERLIAAFLDSNPDFGLDDLAAELPAYASRAPRGRGSRRGRRARADAPAPRPHGRVLHRAAAHGARDMEGEPDAAAKAADRPRPAVPQLRRAVAAPDEPPGPLPLRVLPAPLRADLRVPQLRRALDDRADVLDGDPEVQQLRRLDAPGRMRTDAGAGSAPVARLAAVGKLAA